MEHLALIYFINSTSPPVASPAAVATRPPSKRYVNTFKVPIIVDGIPHASGSTFAALPGSTVAIKGDRIGSINDYRDVGVVVARQSPRMSGREISPVDGVPRVYLYNRLEIPLDVTVVGETFRIAANGTATYDGPSSLPYVPLGLTFKTSIFPDYRFLRPYDVIEFGL